MRARDLLAGLLLLISPWSVPSCGDDAAPPKQAPKPPPKPTGPSVLLVTLDTTRADSLGCYGGPDWATPNLDAIARRGVRFDMARAPTPVTLPSHATIMTGLHPFQHGVRDNGTFVLGEGARTLAERLKEAGYATAAVPASFVVDSTFGLGQGFERYVDLEQKDLAVGDEGEERRADEVVAHATGFLDSLAPDRRFFLWTHFFDPHYPYAPPADLVAAHPYELSGKKRDARWGEQRHLYQVEVAAVDRALGKLLAALDRFGGASEVLIVVVGDHGEGLGQHAEATHAALVYDATMRIPLLFAKSGLPQGSAIAEPVASVDVAPTILALLGLSAEGTTGADLGPLMRGEPFAATRPLYFENCATWFTSGWAPQYGVVEGRMKTIVGPQVRVFDVVADPGETKDLAGEDASPEVQELIERTRETLRSLAEETIAAARHVPTGSELEELHNLGYVVSESSSRREGLVPPGWQPKQALTPEQGLENTRRFTQANQLWQQKKPDEALKTLLALVKDEPENAHYAEIAAALLVQSGRTAEALPLAQKAVELAENVGSRTTLVTCLIVLGKKDEAFAEVATSVQRYPRLLPARLTYSKLLLERNRPADAIPHLEVFVRDFAGDPQVRKEAEALLARARAAAPAKNGPN